MLSLKNVTKDYVTGDTVVNALKGVTIDFRDNEFVSILGASGCGKTTLLNIIGGLDRYTKGDLIINGVSTKFYRDGDWDAYRNHTIGFVFQTYNLIMHQTVLGNVELALTLSGVTPHERKRLATEALEKVGLKDQINKKPNQLSGGQMQRVAIARAIVNNPDIILADEPTGALDTQTSVQIMDILKEIAKDKLVIMVTHNPELAEKYSTRIVRMSDGVMVSDTAPVTDDETNKMLDEVKAKASSKEAGSGDAKGQKPHKSHKNAKKNKSMSFVTALSLSLRNLLTKKARTILVSFAGSIGIIGIALILSISDGFQAYINKVQEDTLSSYPLTIEAETVDMSGMISAIMGAVGEEDKQKEPDTVYSNNLMTKMLSATLNQQVSNNLSGFNTALNTALEGELKGKVTAVKNTYNYKIQAYFEGDEALNAKGQTIKVNPSSMMNSMFGAMASGMGSAMGISTNTWSEMLDNDELIKSQYDLVGENSKWPTKPEEVLVVIDSNEEINDYILYALGILNQDDLMKMMQDIMAGKEVEEVEHKYSYDDLLGLKYKVVLHSQYYEENSDATFKDIRNDEAKLSAVVENGMEVKVVGIIKPKESAAATSISGTIAYLPALRETLMKASNESKIVTRQLNVPTHSVLTGLPFSKTEEVVYTLQNVKDYLYQNVNNSLEKTEEIVNAMVAYFVGQGKTQTQAESQVIEYFKGVIESTSSSDTLERTLRNIGYENVNEPQQISIYAVDFESKDAIVDWIDKYNADARANSPDDVISYTDYIGIMMSSVSTIINAISYVLIGFVSISLVVSSIMIGIITYISVLERTKEIGILRSIGASKRDISRVFNAETFIVGLTAGALGVLIAMLIDIPINLILGALAGLYNIAVLPWWGAVGLVVISVILTLIAGIIPSRMASRKDPVIALRTE